MGKRIVPASNAIGTPNRLKPQSTILAEDAMLLTTRTVTKTAMIRSKKRYCFINGLWMYAISPRGWNGNHQEMHIGIRLIHKLMPDLRWDLQALSLFQHDLLPFEDHRPFPFKNIEELPCNVVIMDDFRSACRNTLLNDAHILA